jgi:hypothetical protein
VSAPQDAEGSDATTVPARSPQAAAAGGRAGTAADDGDTGSDPARVGARPAGAGVRGTNGARIVRLSWAGTALYVVLAAAATVWPGTFQAALMAVCVVLFVAGFVAFAAAYVIAVGRSRTEAIGMGGLYFLAGTAPRAVQRSLVGSLAVETLTAVVSASIGLAVLPADADNLLAFGILTPLYGLGLAGLWGARYGTFPPRPASVRRPARSSAVGVPETVSSDVAGVEDPPTAAVAPAPGGDDRPTPGDDRPRPGGGEGRGGTA